MPAHWGTEQSESEFDAILTGMAECCSQPQLQRTVTALSKADTKFTEHVRDVLASVAAKKARGRGPATPASAGQPNRLDVLEGKKGEAWLVDVGWIIASLVGADRRFAGLLCERLAARIMPATPSSGGPERTPNEPPGKLRDREWFTNLGQIVSILVVAGQGFASTLRVALEANADRLAPTTPAIACTEHRARSDEGEPHGPTAASESPAVADEGTPAAEAAHAETDKTPDDRGQGHGRDVPETPAAATTESEPEHSTGHDGENGPAFLSLRELMQDLPLDRDPFTEEFVDMPKCKVVLPAFLVHFRRMMQRFAGVDRFIRELPVPDEGGLYYGGSSAEKEAARLELSDLGELLDNLREDLYCFLNHVGAGRLVELDDASLAAVRELSRAVPWHARRAFLLVRAAVQHVARLPNRGGILADADQRHREAVDREYGRSPSARPTARDCWPWTDAAGRPITVESEYEPTGELAEPPKPRALRT